MITIYSTTPIYFKDYESFKCVECLTEKGLLNLVKEDSDAIWFVKPYCGTTFSRKFIEEHLTEDGYIKEGFYSTSLCGERVDFRLIEDANCIKTRESKTFRKMITETDEDDVTQGNENVEGAGGKTKKLRKLRNGLITN